MGSRRAKKDLLSFEDLDAWQQCRRVFYIVYHVTQGFPVSEQYGLVSQMRRAAVSSASNIAEGFGRSTKLDKAHFYVMARGSITELKNQCILAGDVGLLSTKELEKLKDELVLAHKLVVGLVKVTRRSNAAHS